MPHLVLLALAAVGVLMFKHAVADFFLQTSYQYSNKGIYGHPGGIIHSAIHVALTPLVYLVLAPGSILIAAGIKFVRGKGWAAQDPGFWYALGTDQFIHGATYLLIVAILIAYGGFA
jgi:hypothetical protein